MRRAFWITSVLVIVIGAIAGGLFARLPARNEPGVAGDYQEALGLIGDNYAGAVKYDNITEASVQGMLWTLDPHSQFFNTKELKKLYEDQASRFYGIGVSILQHRDGVYVQSVVPDTPADKAGLRYGDRFLEVDGQDALKWTSAEVSNKVRGERMTPVHLKVERPGQPAPVEFDIYRDGVPYPSIRESFMLKPDVGYIGLIGGFQETTADELDMAIADLKKGGMKQLVLDLRGNPGGLLPQAIEVSSRFIPRGQVIVSVKGRTNFMEAKDYRAVAGKTEDFPLVVLINGGTASASEIVAGAIQDYGRGLVVGSTSFGKGLVQKVFQLPMHTGMTLTMQRYYTPYGRSLQRDYSNGSIYEYYTHNAYAEEEKAATSTPTPDATASQPAIETAGGRMFYGGRGIEPDIKVPAQTFNTLRGRIAEEAFFFTRQAISGQVPGLENLRLEKQKAGHSLQPGDYEINDRILAAFRDFVTKDGASGLTADLIDKEPAFARLRLRDEFVTAAFSSELGQQVLLEQDPQVLKAIDSLPDARKLAENIKTNIKLG
jgi:carboxyl-terminal processing protease